MKEAKHLYGLALLRTGKEKSFLTFLEECREKTGAKYTLYAAFLLELHFEDLLEKGKLKQSEKKITIFDRVFDYKGTVNEKGQAYGKGSASATVK